MIGSTKTRYMQIGFQFISCIYWKAFCTFALKPAQYNRSGNQEKKQSQQTAECRYCGRPPLSSTQIQPFSRGKQKSLGRSFTVQLNSFLPSNVLSLLPQTFSRTDAWWLQMFLRPQPEKYYPLAHHSSMHCATVLTDSMLIYGTLNQLSKAFNSLFLSDEGSAPLGLQTYQCLSSQADVCYPKATQHIQLQLEI